MIYPYIYIYILGGGGGFIGWSSKNKIETTRLYGFLDFYPSNRLEGSENFVREVVGGGDIFDVCPVYYDERVMYFKFNSAATSLIFFLSFFLSHTLLVLISLSFPREVETRDERWDTIEDGLVDLLSSQRLEMQGFGLCTNGRYSQHSFSLFVP